MEILGQGTTRMLIENKTPPLHIYPSIAPPPHYNVYDCKQMDYWVTFVIVTSDVLMSW